MSLGGLASSCVAVVLMAFLPATSGAAEAIQGGVERALQLPRAEDDPGLAESKKPLLVTFGKGGSSRPAPLFTVEAPWVADSAAHLELNHRPPSHFSAAFDSTAAFIARGRHGRAGLGAAWSGTLMGALGAAAALAVPTGDGKVWEQARERAIGFVTARDKQLHFFASSSLSLSVTTLTGEVRWGVLAALLAGLGKEVVWDHLLGKGDPSAGDMLANALGVGFSCLITYVAEAGWFR